jgi:hypothetical protein
MQLNRDGVRHLAMRLGLGFVMCWFGVQELRSPSEWAVFVPSFVTDISPVAVNDLVLLHGFLLVLAAASVVLGLLYLPGAVLGVGLIAEILFGLWIDSGFNDLVVRDIGLLGLAVAVAADPLRFWHLESMFSRPQTVPRSSRRRAERDPSVAAPARAWPAQLGAAGALVAGVLALGVALNATGSSSSTLFNIGPRRRRTLADAGSGDTAGVRRPRRPLQRRRPRRRRSRPSSSTAGGISSGRTRCTRVSRTRTRRRRWRASICRCRTRVTRLWSI